MDEADLKPFALCPPCLRKISYYLCFDGEEKQRYQDLVDIFKKMN